MAWRKQAHVEKHLKALVLAQMCSHGSEASGCFSLTFDFFLVGISRIYQLAGLQALGPFWLNINFLLLQLLFLGCSNLNVLGKSSLSLIYRLTVLEAIWPSCSPRAGLLL